MSEVKGKLIVKGGTKEYGSNGFKKRTFVIEIPDGEYPQKVEFELVQAKCALLDPIEVGDDVKLTYNLRGREWTNPEGEVKYFNSLQAWKLEIVF